MTLPVAVYDLVCVAVVGAPSTGAFMLGAAVPGYLTAAGNIPDGSIVSYGASDGISSETSKGTISNSGLTLTRGEAPIRGSNGAAVVNFGAGVTVAVIFSGSDLTELLAAVVALQSAVTALQSAVITSIDGGTF